MTAADRLAFLKERIDRAARRAGRTGADITLVGVSKTVPLEKVVPYYEAGLRQLGENRVQEAAGKYKDDSGVSRLPAAQLHLIGPLQSNKARKAVALFDLIQTVDRADLGQDLNRLAGETGKIQDCLIQVKVSDEPTKSGLGPSHLPELIQAFSQWPHLRLRGLMGIPPLQASGDRARPYFATLRRLFEDSFAYAQARRIADSPSADAAPAILSMGMSGDYEAAIEEGATLVRIGTALFGERV